MSSDKDQTQETVLLPKNRWYKFAGKKKTVLAQEYTPEERAWDELLLETTTDPHYMQASAWGESKTHSQWPISRYVAKTGEGVLPLQVFSRTVPGLGRLHYSPEVVGVTSTNLPAITAQLREQFGKGLAFKLELYQPYSEELIEAFQKNGWIRARSVQHRNTVIVDLEGTEEELLARIKKRARYEVRVAQRSNIRVEKVEVTQKSLQALATLMDATAKRTGAFFRKNTYTNNYWRSFSKTGQGSLYFAWHDKDLLAGAYVVRYGQSAWYKDGGSVRIKSELMGPRFLQWEIMKDLQSQGVKRYDLSGIPAKDDVETSTMRGLYAFKTGFAKENTQFMPAMELPFGHRYPVWRKSENSLLRLYSGLTKDFWY